MKGEEGEEGEEEEEQLSSSSDTWFCLLCGYHRRVFVAFLKNSFQLFLLFGFFFANGKYPEKRYAANVTVGVCEISYVGGCLGFTDS